MRRRTFAISAFIGGLMLRAAAVKLRGQLAIPRATDFRPHPRGAGKKLPIPPSCTAHKRIGHVVRCEGKLFDFHQNVALGCGTAR
jgi:hypothetical protein